MNRVGADSQAGSNEAQWSQWMIRAQQGDDSCYRSLLSELGTAIENYVRRRFGPTDFVEDVVQESLLAIHQARHTYTAGRPFRPWLYAIVRHKAIDMLRRKNTHRHLVASGAIDDVEPADCGQRMMDNSVEDLLASEQLFHGLKRQSRQALILTKVVGLTMAEAAANLGVSETAMKVRVHRALRELRSCLEVR